MFLIFLKLDEEIDMTQLFVCWNEPKSNLFTLEIREASALRETMTSFLTNKATTTKTAPF